MRVQEEQQAAQPSPDTQKVITVTYTGGRNSKLQLSRNDITLHVGQQIHLCPWDNSGDAGELRLMTDGHADQMGAINPQGCLTSKGVGKQGYKGSNTEMLLTANQKGNAVLTVVPNYGDWDHAVKIHIRIE